MRFHGRKHFYPFTMKTAEDEMKTAEDAKDAENDFGPPERQAFASFASSAVMVAFSSIGERWSDQECIGPSLGLISLRSISAHSG